MAAGVFSTMRLGGEAVAIAVLGSLLTMATRSGLAEPFDRRGTGARRWLDRRVPARRTAGGGRLEPDAEGQARRP
jgi:hypothetical protein